MYVMMISIHRQVNRELAMLDNIYMTTLYCFVKQRLNECCILVCVWETQVLSQ